ncbi:hypothetical protein FQN55_001410 [Onygenales sp. PD_40]|nr:hypothetical protein FQN55_001410 [Onygenales sp. PD_40]KAK2796054.1 hypothetical protein FQN52_000027 [Onygenales sp. PD_12]
MTDTPPPSTSSPAPPPATRRRFLPQPIEISSRSSNPFASSYNLSQISSSNSSRSHTAKDQKTIVPDNGAGHPSPNQPVSNPVPGHPAPRHLPQAQGPAAKSGLPQPVEHSTRSSRDSKNQDNAKDAGGGSPKRKFVPEPIETVTRSNRQSAPKSSRIAPQLIETTTQRKGKGKGNSSTGSGSGNDEKPLSSDDHMGHQYSLPLRSGGSSGSGTPRKFSPQLIETATRSVRQHCLVRGTAEYPDHPRTSPSSASQQKHTDPEGTESRFSYANILRRQEAKRHSFRVPDLPVIRSNSSEDSEKSPAQSLSTSPSTVSNRSNKPPQDKGILRESCDDRFSGYLLSLAARSAKKMLRDQALAAYPNEQVYHPVSHFAIDREDDDTTDEDDDTMDIALGDMKIDLAKFRRESTVDLAYELEEMRRHKEESEMRARQHMFDSGQSRFSAAAIAARQAENEAIKNMGINQMRNAASPPMLGGDIVFPKSLSPQSTRCDVDQAPVPHHDVNCANPEICEGLWSPTPGVNGAEEGGLWMGMCRRTHEPEQTNSPLPRPGIITPAITNEEGPFQSLNAATTTFIPPPSPNQLPTTPPLSSTSPPDPGIENMDRLLSLEEDIAAEFDDAFVTQIYNYLSLGYPCLARDFDEELSKISRIPVEELRKDDKRVDAKGYVGAPEGNGVGEDGVLGGKCMRWTALRLYIWEWARQRSRMKVTGMADGEKGVDAWGARARRGSWAI